MKTNQQEIATPSKNVAKRTPTQTLTYVALLCALCIVLKWITNSLSTVMPASLKLSLSYLGWFLSAIIVGPYYGGLIAVLSDLIGQFILQTGGAPNPILLAGNGLATFSFGLIYHFLPKFIKNDFADKVLKTVLGAIVSVLVGTLGLNTFGLWLYYYSKTDYFAFFITRFTQLVMPAINTAVVILLIPAVKKLKLEYTPKRKKAQNDACENRTNENGNQTAENE